MVDLFNTIKAGPTADNDSPDKATIEVDGEKFGDWTSLSITRGLSQLSGEFEFTVSNRYPGDFAEGIGLYMGAECKVRINDEQVICGYIDEMPIEYSAGSYSITYRGRDKTADLVDCTFNAEYNKNELKNQTPYNIVSKLCAPFGITVRFDDLSALTEMNDMSVAIVSFGVRLGTPVFEQVSEVCRTYGVIPYSKGDGDLWLTRASTKRTDDSLQSGINILSARYNISDRDRFRLYCAKSPIAKNSDTETASITSGIIKDEGIERDRSFTIIDANLKTIEDCKKRATWEMDIRAGASRKLDVTVQGWTQSNKAVWPLNRIVHVLDDYLGIDDDFLIAHLNYVLGSGGSITDMGLVPPVAFELPSNKVGRDMKSDVITTFAEDNKKALKLASIKPSNFKR
jgi:prophage tail gpP-like protein